MTRVSVRSVALSACFGYSPYDFVSLHTTHTTGARPVSRSGSWFEPTKELMHTSTFRFFFKVLPHTGDRPHGRRIRIRTGTVAVVSG